LRLIEILSRFRAVGPGLLLGGLVLLAGCSVPKFSNPFGSDSESSPTGFASERLPEMGEGQPTAPAADPSGKSLNCPQVVAWPNERLLTHYEPGHDGDAKSVIYRGEITKLSRECQFFGGQVQVKYGFAGRVLLGPKGKPATVTLPVNIRAADAFKQTLATDKMSISATVPQGAPVGYFSMVRELTFPIQVGTRPEDYKIFVGFKK
jgi:hypothetical protein